MALCGDEDYGKDAIETCFEVIGRQTPEKRGVSSVREAVRRVLTKILNEYNKSNLEPSLRPSFLVALGLRETGTVLFTTAETSIRTVAHWQCHGSGGAIANYIIRNSYENGIDTPGAIMLGLRALVAAKQHDVYCGGHSQFLVIRNGRVSEIVPYDLTLAEQQIAEYERATSRLLLNIGHPDIDELQFNNGLWRFDDNAKKMRADMREAGKPYLEMLASLFASSKATTSRTSQT
jgi:hypothetical protein